MGHRILGRAHRSLATARLASQTAGLTSHRELSIRHRQQYRWLRTPVVTRQLRLRSGSALVPSSPPCFRQRGAVAATRPKPRIARMPRQPAPLESSPASPATAPSSCSHLAGSGAPIMRVASRRCVGKGTSGTYRRRLNCEPRSSNAGTSARVTVSGCTWKSGSLMVGAAAARVVGSSGVVGVVYDNHRQLGHYHRQSGRHQQPCELPPAALNDHHRLEVTAVGPVSERGATRATYSKSTGRATVWRPRRPRRPVPRLA
jgi:hypothetical protein